MTFTWFCITYRGPNGRLAAMRIPALSWDDAEAFVAELSEGRVDGEFIEEVE